MYGQRISRRNFSLHPEFLGMFLSYLDIIVLSHFSCYGWTAGKGTCKAEFDSKVGSRVLGRN